jgi:hypothetical protein
MLRLYSFDDYEGLPSTKWNIKQPEACGTRDEALSSGKANDVQEISFGMDGNENELCGTDYSFVLQADSI